MGTVKLHSMFAVLLLLGTASLAECENADDIGYFWHVADFHYDNQYSTEGVASYYCHYWNETAAEALGYYGDYECDSPLSLIIAAVQGMKELKSDADFIIWTGDDAAHVPDSMVGEELMTEIIQNLTNIIKGEFPNTQVYPAIANHDYHPSNQLPPYNSAQYDAIAAAWSSWLTDDPTAVDTLKTAGYYTLKMDNGIRLIVPNNNLYYTSNKVTKDMPDPADQFVWIEDTLEAAKVADEKVWVVAHIPPGHPEKSLSPPWFYPEYNARYTGIMEKYADIIVGQFYAHHHSDHFKIYYNQDGEPINSMLLAPAVVPWRNKYVYRPEFGANNPAIRLVKFQRSTGKLLDIIQYMTNLTEANEKGQPSWVQEYIATEAYSIDDVTTESLHGLVESMRPEGSENFAKYNLYNSVSYDTSPCDEVCKRTHICAITNIKMEEFDACMEGTSTGHINAVETIPILLSMVAVTRCSYLI
ncbi:acid sphingomyelinase-like phosphodiesterase 3b [Ptychodera flava]|uniref:acid sphingomyelinase-like phosphodiesterase 3b n=1 Tax=Ptychodera flava TaxID=63121 RepID=UPI00396A8946